MEVSVFFEAMIKHKNEKSYSMAMRIQDQNE